jgi:hypothetical protein
MITSPEKIVHILPHEIMTFVANHYPDGNIFDVLEVNRMNGDVKYYAVDVVDDKNTYHLRFDKKGVLLHEEEEIGIEEVSEERDSSVTDDEIDEI